MRAVVEDLRVSPLRAGHGTRLLSKAVDVAREMGLDEIYVHAVANSLIAMPALTAFYEKNGFELLAGGAVMRRSIEGVIIR
jgi:GNAT superfamily N-acetyltransferase